MIALLLAAALWLALHIGVSGTRLRDAAVARLGENPFRGVFSLASVISIVLLAWAYRAAPYVSLWTLPAWAEWVLAAVLLPAFVLFTASVTSPNPTAVGQAGEPRGMARVTRHPMLVSFGLWAVVHLVANGDVASLVLFGTILVTVLGGIPSIDRKLEHGDPERWRMMAAHTSIVPGAAIAAGRNRFVAEEIAWYVWVGGVVLWVAALLLHPLVVGVPALPPG